MPHSEQYAKELLRLLPSRVATLLEQRKYWDLTFLRLYLEYCDRVLFEDPRAGLEAAKVAPVLALRVPEKRPYDWQHFTDESEKQQHRELSAKSYAVLGGAFRAAARFEEAEKAYGEAARICASGPIDPVVKANIDKRLAKLRSAQKRFDEALELLDLSIEVYRNQDEVYFADALVTKGYVLGESGRPSEAIPYFAEAFGLVKVVGKKNSLARRVFESAIQNLADTLSEGCYSNDVILALRYVAEAKRFLSRKPNSVNKQKIIWIEGRIAAKLGSTRAAERLFFGAKKQLLKLGAPFEAAMVALDLSLIYLQQAEWAKLKELAAETFERFAELLGDEEAIGALRLWVAGAQMKTLTKATILSSRDTISARLRRNPR